MKLDWERLDAWADRYGDSFYLLDLDAFEANYGEFLSAFRARYARSQIAYSYKTNYIPRLGRCVDELGGYAEVVSDMEYELALRSGVAPERIVLNGPYKDAGLLRKALQGGAIVNLDGPYEVALVEALAASLPDRQLEVGLRCNLDLGQERVSRFGFDAEGDDLRAAFGRLNRLDNCRVAGLHCHYTTPRRELEAYDLRTRKMLALCAELYPGAPPRYLDLGGGYFGKVDEALRRQFDVYMPTYDEYAETVGTLVARAYPGEAGPELILEPGIALAGNVMSFVARVIDLKTVRGRKMALVSGSVHNVQPTLHQKNPSTRVYHRPDGDSRLAGADLVGYTCLEYDCIYYGYPGEVGAGDYVVFDQVGAYVIVFKPPFIRGAPAILGHRADQVELVRRAERSGDLFATYAM